MAALQSDQLEREMNFAAREVEVAMGTGQVLPRHPQRQLKIIHGGPVTFNHISVNESSIAVLNTGNLEIVDSAITVLSSNSQTQDIATAISELTNAIANSGLPTDKKNEAVEILTTVASEATAAKEKRKSSVVKGS